MRGINKVIILGTLGKDPQVRQFPNSGLTASVSMATSEVWNDKNTGERQEKTEWHRVVFNGRQAEIAQQYLRKGSKLYVEGKLQTRSYTDQNGVERAITEIIVLSMQIIDSPTQQSPQPQQGQNHQQQQTNYQRQAPQQQYTQNGYQLNQGFVSHTSNDEPDDELPF